MENIPNQRFFALLCARLTTRPLGLQKAPRAACGHLLCCHTDKPSHQGLWPDTCSPSVQGPHLTLLSGHSRGLSVPKDTVFLCLSNFARLFSLRHLTPPTRAELLELLHTLQRVSPKSTSGNSSLARLDHSLLPFSLQPLLTEQWLKVQISEPAKPSPSG